MVPSFSIVIPSYARADLLAFCLNSVSQFAPSGTEILVVDDASKGELITKTALGFPGIRVVRLPKRSGFCVAANAGVQVANGEIVELLNDDAEVTANWAEAALRWFADPAIAAVSPLVLQQGTAGMIDTAGDEYDRGGFARKRGHGQQWSDGLYPAGPVWGVSGAAGFYRRSSFLEVGGFPESFGAYFEDVDLAFRLQRAGHRAWFEPNSVVHHRVSASYGKRPSRRTLVQQSCNEERVFWRNGSSRNVPRHLAVLAGKFLRRLEEGEAAPWVTGRVQATLIRGDGPLACR